MRSARGRWGLACAVWAAASVVVGACASKPVAPTAATVRAANVGVWWSCAPEKLQVATLPGFAGCLNAASYRALLRQVGAGQGADEDGVGDGGVEAVGGPDPRPYVGDRHVCAMAFEVHGCMQRQVFICHGGGACAALTERTAYAESDAECRALGQCKRFGECALGPGNSCRASTEEDCQRSTDACGVMGRCQLDQRGLCVAREDAACAGASWCRDLGRCEARDGTCVAGSDAGCRGSTECTTRTRCWARDGICVNEPPRPDGPRD